MNNRIFTLLLILLLLTACQGRPTTVILPTETLIPVPTAAATSAPTPTVADTAAATPTSDSPRQVLSIHYDMTTGSAFQVDLRSEDLSDYDLREAAGDLFYADFSTQTKWPEAQWLPAGFDPQKIIELGKDPGLGVRSLHAQGITGKGVSIAIIDQPLTPPDHVEYDGRVKVYEKIGNAGDMSMHGPAVASIAVGKTVGVAPEANLYFFAAEIPVMEKDGQRLRDFKYIAQAVRRVIEINQSLPAAEKIRVLSISIGWSALEPGYDEMEAAVGEARKAGIFVVSSNLENTYAGYKFNGMGRDPMGDPNQNNSYEAGTFWASRLMEPTASILMKGRILVPMDSRTYASYLGKDEYNWGRAGGWSWSIPYLAGLYALAVQVDPALTPETFWKAVTDTAQPLTVPVDGKDTAIGQIIQPVPMIEALKK